MNHRLTLVLVLALAVAAVAARKDSGIYSKVMSCLADVPDRGLSYPGPECASRVVGDLSNQPCSPAALAAAVDSCLRRYARFTPDISNDVINNAVACVKTIKCA